MRTVVRQAPNPRLAAPPPADARVTRSSSTAEPAQHVRTVIALARHQDPCQDPARPKAKALKQCRASHHERTIIGLGARSCAACRTTLSRRKSADCREEVAMDGTPVAIRDLQSATAPL